MTMKPSDGYILLIANPKSGATDNNEVVQGFRRHLEDSGYEVRLVSTESLEHAQKLSNQAGEDTRCGMTVVAGGDGTVRSVVHGLAEAGKPIMILPSGTENLFANELGLEMKAASLIKTFDEGYVRTVDLGNANGRWFTCVIGFGFDGEVVQRVSEKRTGHITHLSYFWPLWNTFWHHRFPGLRVVVDGEEVFDGRGLVLVGNISRYAVGLNVLQEADVSDGLLDVCIYECKSWPRLLKHSVNTVVGRHKDRGDVVYVQGKEIKVTSHGEDVKTEIDGDPGPSLPVTIEVIPAAARMVAPKGGRPAGMYTRFLRRAFG